MKIAIFDPYLNTMSGGEKYMLSLAFCLKEAHDVSIMWDKSPKDEIVSLARKRFSYNLEEFSFVSSIFTPSISMFERYKKSKEYDAVIYLSDGSIPILACSLIIHFQSPMLWVRGKSIKNRLKLKKVKDIICNSKFTKKYIDKSFGVNSTVLYPPVLLQGSASNKKENLILNVGRFGINHAGSSYKKQDVLAQAFEKMAKENNKKDWRLVFIMSTLEQDRDALDDFIAKYKKNNMDFVINPDNDTLWEYYRKAKIYWHGAGYGEDVDLHPDRAEHFGISTVEAMGMGAVPVVFSAGGQKEIVDHQVNGILWSTVDELKRYTLDLMENQELLGELSKKSIVDAQKYSLDSFCQHINEIIRQ